jgi:hypothetical protein
VLLAVKNKPEEEEKAAAMRGKFICAGKPTPSIILKHFRSHRELNLRSENCSYHFYEAL